MDNLDNKLDNGTSLEQIIEGQLRRLRQLDGATQLIRSKVNVKNELQKMCDEVSQVSVGIQNLRQVLEKVKEQNARCRELSSLIEFLDKKILHQTEYVPQELIQSYQNADNQACTKTMISSNMWDECTVNPNQQYMGRRKQKTPSSIYKNINEKQETIKDCKRTLFSEPEICPVMPFLTVEEFNKIPKYIIGRQTLNTINSLINAINQTLIAKYTILSWGKAVAQKKGEINLFLHYKKQELDIKQENGHLYFFTAEDYYRQTKTKIDKTKLNLITALRHCKRLRECRIKNEIYYVITPH